MKKVTPEQYVTGVNSIAIEEPEYELGADGSNGKCDCIGMGRGGLIRAGIPESDIRGMNGTNYAARHTIDGLQKLKKEDQLRLGDVVFKTRDKDDKSMPLPDKYRKGGSDYSERWGETNFTHYGTVTQVNPIRITHMTSPTAKVDTSIKGWGYFGKLPWVDYGIDAEATWVTVYAESGQTVKMRAKPSSLCRLYWEVPIGSQVVLMEPGDTWSGIIWNGQSGWMMTKYLRATGTQDPLYTVIIEHLSGPEAEKLIAEYKTATKEEEKG